MKKMVILLWLVFSVVVCGGCDRHEPTPEHATRPVVVTTLFPLYDFARSIVGSRMEVKLLLPPGVEPHHFEPRPEDIVTIQRAALFIYTSPAMEPWAARLLAGLDQRRLRVVQAAAHVRLREIGQKEQDDDAHDLPQSVSGHRQDPHVWLDFGNAQQMVDEMLAGIVAVDPGHAGEYRANATALQHRLADLDRRFTQGLANCTSRVVLHGGHYAFGYLARRYHLTYLAAEGVSADNEPSPRQLAELVQQIRSNRLGAVFSEELVSPRLADSLAAETGVRVLRLNGAHNLTKDQFERGVTFFDLMEQNLHNLRQGLGCR